MGRRAKPSRYLSRRIAPDVPPRIALSQSGAFLRLAGGDPTPRLPRDPLPGGNVQRTLLALLLLCAAPASAQLFSDGFEGTAIEPLFPVVGGSYQLPPGPTTDQLDWLLAELAAGESTTAAEVNDHFSSSWLASFTVAQTQAFLQQLRSAYPDAVLDDIVSVTPVRMAAVLRSPVNGQLGFLQLGASYTAPRRIVLLGVSGYSGSVQYPADQSLTLEQAADRFQTLSSAPSLLVARIDAGGQCQALLARNAATPRATASIFKIWVLAAVAQAIEATLVDPSQLVPMLASELAPGGIINSEPLGTGFSVLDLAILMMGISDNTATDLLHELVGRDLANQAVAGAGMADPELLTPLLGINEQFHLFYSFPLAESLSYVNGSEPFQAGFLASEIEPLGPVGNGPHPYFHPTLLTEGSWKASAVDVCQAYAHLHALDAGPALHTVDHALGAGVAQPGVRASWDRVWFKGGSLNSTSTNQHVLTLAWMLERSGSQPLVVVAMSNSQAGGIDQFQVQSVTSRILELVAELP